MEGRLAARGQARQFSEDGQVLRFERVAPGAKDVERLAVFEKHGLLGFVDDELGHGVEVFGFMLVHQHVVRAFVLKDVVELHGIPPL